MFTVLSIATADNLFLKFMVISQCFILTFYFASIRLLTPLLS